MSAYYNENDPALAEWLRALIKDGRIAPGEVDDRSIWEVSPSDVRDFRQVHFFAGLGLWSLALRNAGWPDDNSVWTGSCPCQPFSQAGRRAGFADDRHLWPAMHWLIRQCRPGVVFGEQVAGTAGEEWLDVVSTDLEAEDYAFGSHVLPACSVGAPHRRERAFWVADCNRTRLERWGVLPERRYEQPAWPGGVEVEGLRPTSGFWRDIDWLLCSDQRWRPVEPGTFPLDHGHPDRVVRIKGCGNAIVEPLAREFITSFIEMQELCSLSE
jgi:DNA (cytosine-5)-methyltransferase 1